MATLTFNEQYFEYNGGVLSYFKIDVSSYSAPSVYGDYTQFGGTEGIAIDFSTEQEEVFSDQSFAATDLFTQATSAKIMLTIQETTLTKLLIAMGYDYSDFTNILVSGETDLSVIDATSGLSTTRAYFGKARDNIYMDLQFEKQRSHDLDKIFGFRIYKATPTGNLKYSAKVKEKGFFDMEFLCLGSNLHTDHNNNIGYFFDEA